MASSMLAIARPNPYEPPQPPLSHKKKGNSTMLRKMHSSRASRSNGDSLSERLARVSTRLNPARSSSRSNGNGETLDDILARLRSRQNPSSRKNPDFASRRQTGQARIAGLGKSLAELRNKSRTSIMDDPAVAASREMIEQDAKELRKALSEAAGVLKRDLGHSKSSRSSSSKKSTRSKKRSSSSSKRASSSRSSRARKNEAGSHMNSNRIPLIDVLRQNAGAKRRRKATHKRKNPSEGTTSISDLLRARREMLLADSYSRSNGASALEELRANAAKRRKKASSTARKRKASSTRRRKNEAIPLLDVLRANAAKKKRASTAKRRTRKNGVDTPLIAGLGMLENPRKKRRKSSAAKKTSTTSRGGAKSTKFYAKLPAAKRAAFVKNFDTLYKKYNAMRGVSSAQARARAALAANAKIKSARKNGDDVDLLEESTMIELYPNPRRKARKSAVRKRTVRKSSAASAKSSKFYGKLPAAKKAKFVAEFNKLYKSYNAKKGVSSAQAAARAALAANARVRRNPADDTEIAAPLLANPKRKARKSTARKSTARKSTARKSSTGSVRAAAMKSAFYKKLPATKKAAFVRQFESLHKKYSAQKGVTSAQARARAALAANARVKAGRRNPVEVELDDVDTLLANPKRRSRKTSSRRKTSSSRRTTRTASGTRARAKRFKTGMSSNAKKVLSKYGPYEVKVQMGGKVSTIKANKSSSDYLSARKSGLKGGMRLLSGKANSPASLNLRSVYKVVDGKPSRADFQRAVNTWAGAVDGGHVRGVTKRHLSARMNASDMIRRHTISALENPAPMSAFMHRNAAKSSSEKWIGGGVGVASGVATLYGANWMSSSLGNMMGVTTNEVADKSGWKYWVSEAAVPAVATLGFGLGLHSEMKKSDSNTRLIGLYSGMIAGAVSSFLLRAVLPRTWGAAIPGFAKTSADNTFETAKERGIRELNELKAAHEAAAEDKKEAAKTAYAAAYKKLVETDKVLTAQEATAAGLNATLSGFLVDRQLGSYPLHLLPNGDTQMVNRVFGLTGDRSIGLDGFTPDRSVGLGRYVEQTGRYVEQTGRYVGSEFNDDQEAKLAKDRLVADIARSQMDARGLGMYETSAEANEQMHSYDADGSLMGLGAYEPNFGAMVDAGHDELANYEYGYSPRMNPAMAPKLDTGATLQVAPINTQAVNDGMYSIKARHQLKEDLELYEPLSPDDMAAEGITQVSDTGEEYKIVRATPDVARQIVEANFGNLIGASRVVPNTLLVLASIYDAPQAPVLSDRLRLNRAPEVPKSASYPQAGGLFSRVIFSSHFPSIDNMPSFQEFGVRPNR